MQSYSRATSTAHGVHHRHALSRLLPIAVGLGLIAVLVPAAQAQASSHVYPDLILGGPGSPDLPLEFTELDLEAGSSGTHVYRGAAGGLDDFGVWLVVSCETNGRNFAFGANGSDIPLSLDVDTPGADPGSPLQIPAAGPDGPGWFAAIDPFDCSDLAPEAPSRLPRLTGVASHDGVGRNCPSFDADVAFTDRKPFGDYDTYTMRGNQAFPIVHTNPLVAVDESKLFDEVHLYSADTPGEGGPIPGVTIGGGRGTLPNARKLDRLIADAFADQDTELIAKIMARRQADKAATPLIKALGAKGNPCSYATRLSLDPGQDPLGVAVLLDGVLPPPREVTAEPRFETRLTWSDGTPADLEPLRVVADGVDVTNDPDDATGRDFWFFASDDWEVLVTVLDGCSFNDQFWVFQGATTDIEYSLNVTDTVSGAVRELPGPGGALPEPILDTQAFSTCP